MKLDERRAYGLCFWCDEKFALGHRCKTKRLYSIRIIDDEEDTEEEDNKNEDYVHEILTPLISLDALEGIVGFHTLQVTKKVDKHSLFIIVDSGSTHYFIYT